MLALVPVTARWPVANTLLPFSPRFLFLSFFLSFFRFPQFSFLTHALLSFLILLFCSLSISFSLLLISVLSCHVLLIYTFFILFLFPPLPLFFSRLLLFLFLFSYLFLFVSHTSVSSFFSVIFFYYFCFTFFFLYFFYSLRHFFYFILFYLSLPFSSFECLGGRGKKCADHLKIILPLPPLHTHKLLEYPPPPPSTSTYFIYIIKFSSPVPCLPQPKKLTPLLLASSHSQQRTFHLTNFLILLR
ncbi:unnamed protein product [Acanthosepion pharaonis]|uniref:Uncharacterized protein n=1 Tax=Acanthosepion pharaonis TaxID=158019 RepID=A0A812ATS3_ACAPH|nr:unnamed protein product [Sepia pharaonis]